MAKKKSTNFKKILFTVVKVIGYAFLFSFVYVIICKWVWPPFTTMQLVSLVSGDGLKRDYVSWNKISPNVKLAAIAGEDQLFTVHNGFDWKAINKSVHQNNSKTNGRIAGAAASTISQQTAKNVFLYQGEGITRYMRKATEFIYTKLIEWIWGKQRILEVYLNVIEMGKGIYGIEAASQAYYRKHASALTRAQAAGIIAVLPCPSSCSVKPPSNFVLWKSKWIQRQMKNLQSDPSVKNLVYSK